MKRLFLSVVLFLCLHSSFKIVVGQTTACKPTCTEIGAFEIYDGTCKSYYLCENDGEKFNPILLSCASSAIFDPLQGRCVPENTTTYVCTQTTTIPPTTSAPLCIRYGRFPIPDVECKKYYLCYWNGGRYVIMNNLTCPKTLVFNPISEKCVPPQSYNCSATTVTAGLQKTTISPNTTIDPGTTVTMGLQTTTISPNTTIDTGTTLTAGLQTTTIPPNTTIDTGTTLTAGLQTTTIPPNTTIDHLSTTQQEIQ